MTSAIDGIDHCVILVRDLDAGQRSMARLGFTVTPRGTHSAHMGTANHCMMLRRGYVELLAVLTPTEVNARWRRLLDVRTGLSAVPLSTSDAEAARAELAARGVDTVAVVDFSRPVDLPEGRREAAFRILPIPPEHTPGASIFLCQHLTPEVVRHPDYLDHANGALGVSAVTAVHPAPGEVAPAYARLLGAERVHAGGDAVVIDTGGGEIRFLTPAAFAARYAGVALDEDAVPPYLAALSLECGDREAAAAHLERVGVAHVRLANGNLCVAPAEACATLFEFV